MHNAFNLEYINSRQKKQPHSFVVLSGELIEMKGLIAHLKLKESVRRRGFRE